MFHLDLQTLIKLLRTNLESFSMERQYRTMTSDTQSKVEGIH